MRILFISQWFEPEPVTKGLQFARALRAHGHEVVVFTGLPNYPGGKIYDGYAWRLLQAETVEGVRVLRFPLYPSHGTSSFGRAMNYCSFAASLSLLGTALARRFDVAYCYHPPITVGLASSLLTGVHGLPLLYDVQDLWPDSLRATGMIRSEIVLSGVERACQQVYKHARVITVLSPGLKKAIVSRGVPSSKVEVVYNWADEQNLESCVEDPSLADELHFRGRFNVVFAGMMGKAQDIGTLLDAAEIVQHRNPHVLMTLVGGGVEVDRLRWRAEQLRLSNVQFVGRVPMSEIGRILKIADVLLIHLKDDPLFRITIPSKTQDYMAVGKPILMAVSGDAAELVRKAEAGIICQPGDPQTIASAICSMASLHPEELRRLGSNGQRFYSKEMSMAAGVRRFEEIMAGMISADNEDR